MIDNNIYMFSENRNKSFKSQMIHFKKGMEKTLAVKMMNDMIKFIYRTDTDALIYDYKPIMSSLRRCIVCSSAFIINPILLIPTYLADKFIDGKVNDKKTARLIDANDKEIEKLDDLLKEENDAEVKKNLKRLKEKYKDANLKLNSYRENHGLDRKEKDEFDDFDIDLNLDESYRREDMVIEEIILERALDDLLTFIQENKETEIDELSKELSEVLEIMGCSEELLQEKVRNKQIRKLKTQDKKVSGKLDTKVETIINDIKKSLVGDNRENIIKGSMPKLSKIVKGAILTGATWMISPAIAVVGVFGFLLAHKKVKDSEKRKILAELKEELRLVQEKIKDADSKGDSKKKYELMRIEHKIQRNIERVRYDNQTEK